MTRFNSYTPGSTPVDDTGFVTHNPSTGKEEYTLFSNIQDGIGTAFGDASTNTSTSVDGEIALLSGTGGKTLKRATSTGIIKATSGVIGTATAGTDYYNPGGTDVAVADGGTGSSTASGARTNLGVAIGSDVQAYSAKLSDVAAITPSQGDIMYYNGSNWTRLAAGTSSYVLKTNGAGANPSWTAQGTGQTLFDCTVAPSGGDYTLLSAALTAGETSIFIRNGTYTDGNVMSIPANANIVGESRDGVIIDFNNVGRFAYSASNNAIIRNLTVKTWSNYAIQCASASSDCQFINMRFECNTTSYNTPMRLGGFRRVTVLDCLFYNSSANTSDAMIQDLSTFFTGMIIGCTFQGNWQSAMKITDGSIVRFSNNYCQSTNTTAHSSGVVDMNYVGSLHDCSIENNYLAHDSSISAGRGVKLQNCLHLSVRDNNIAVASSSGVGVELIDTSDILVANNFVITGSNGVTLGSGTTETRLTGNHFETCTVPYVLAGSYIWWDNGLAVASKSSNYTLTFKDQVCLATGTTTITLPTAVGVVGRTYTVKKTDIVGTNVTIATTSSQTIDGATTVTLATQYASYTVMSDGASWQVISKV